MWTDLGFEGVALAAWWRIDWRGQAWRPARGPAALPEGSKGTRFRTCHEGRAEGFPGRWHLSMREGRKSRMTPRFLPEQPGGYVFISCDGEEAGGAQFCQRNWSIHWVLGLGASHVLPCGGGGAGGREGWFLRTERRHGWPSSGAGGNKTTRKKRPYRRWVQRKVGMGHPRQKGSSSQWLRSRSEGECCCLCRCGQTWGIAAGDRGWGGAGSLEWRASPATGLKWPQFSKFKRGYLLSCVLCCVPGQKWVPG